MEPGWIYVLVNSSIPGLVKVGRTCRPPAERAAELSAATGVATPFVLAFDQAVADSCAAERAVHAELDRRGLRAAPNREFFRGSPSEIVRVVLEVAEADGHPAPSAADEGSAGLLLMAGDRCLFGLGDTLQDTGEALRLYRLAAMRGALVAFERLGQVYCRMHAARPDRVSRRRALSPLKEGARRGNHYCYAEMAGLFAGEGHIANVVKAWDLFFDRQAHAGESAQDVDRLAVACCRYVAMCLELGLIPEHRDDLFVMADAMIATLLRELDQLRTDASTRHRLARILRWTYQSLLPSIAQAPPRRVRPGRQPTWLPQPEPVVAC